MRRVRWVLVVTALVSLAGCSQATPAEVYFSELKTTVGESVKALAQWEDEADDAMAGFTSAGEAEEAFLLVLEDLRAITQTLLMEVEELTPSDAVADEHAVLVDSIRAQLHAFQALVDEYETLGLEGAIAFILGQEGLDLKRAFIEACADLQLAAEDSGIGVDLNCEG